ncbi:iron-sulfur cluster assembly scaffold protein [Candidatus Gracilibacteria bacterium]|nr:iron-sulfur cluster assembly scaffold protein [Candidatus Gracilibacteria bacterium]MCF7898814.1 iron-sulfur cluster assembly scaffold protein [Candidatus Paceibacterota bacterium]
MSTNEFNKCDGEDWLYSDIVKEHFFHPQNILIDDKDYVADGIGVTGSPLCGDMMAVWIKVDRDKNVITECKWRTFGCASAIASTSMMSVMVVENGGMDLHKAKRLTPEAIIERLSGLPDRKYHCSVLSHLALREAIDDYQKIHAKK